MFYRCKYCGWVGFRQFFEIDHSIPQSRSPLANMLGNLQLICSGCNRQKGIMTDPEYRNWRRINLMKVNFGPIRN